MKVLLTHERFLPDFGGGGERIVFESARHLMGRGVDVRVLTTGDPSLTEYEGVPTVRLPIHRYAMNYAVREIAAHARSADLIHTFTYHASLPSLVAGKWLGKPVICEALGLFHEGWKHMRGPVIGRAFMAWERFLVTRRFARVLFLSDYSRALGLSLGIPEPNAITTCPGIALSEYSAPDRKDQAVLFVGKLETRKGIHDVIEVARRLPEVCFRVIGWGPEGPGLAATAPPNVEFAGFQEGAPLREAFARARIFFFPSKAETFGLVLAEAMASGCALVSTVPIPFAGVHVAPGDRDAMTAAVRDLWNDRDATARMGRDNVELARAYTWERYTDVVLRAYTGVLREDAAAAIA
jgi:glycosyltransferase involved in cell wall biosynthesis